MKTNITSKINNIKIPQSRRIFYSFLIAFIFWFFIKSEDSYLVTQKIPLVARNLQEQKTYKEEVPDYIFVTMKGSGRSFIWLTFFENFYDDYKAILDLSSIADEYNFDLNNYYRDNPTKIVLPTSLDLEFIEVVSPRNIVINLDQYLVKKVPIKSQFLVSTEAGYVQVGNPLFSPDSISIGGLDQVANTLPEDILVTIDFREWSPKKQFYSPKIDIPNNLFKWENLSPNNLEILVVDREEPIKDN